MVFKGTQPDLCYCKAALYDIQYICFNTGIAETRLNQPQFINIIKSLLCLRIWTLQFSMQRKQDIPVETLTLNR